MCFVTDFCWMCCGDWKNHGSEYYECSRYKSNPNIVNESAGIQAREALKKYLFYFERVCDNQGRIHGGHKCWDTYQDASEIIYPLPTPHPLIIIMKARYFIREAVLCPFQFFYFALFACKITRFSVILCKT